MVPRRGPTRERGGEGVRSQGRKRGGGGPKGEGSQEGGPEAGEWQRVPKAAPEETVEGEGNGEGEW